MTGPIWLTVGLAVVMLATAFYCAGHLVASWIALRAGEPDVDVMHIAMGIVMAGMLVAALDQRWNNRLGLGFAASAAWFALRGVRILSRPGSLGRTVGHSQHAVACAAMVYMLIGFSTPAAQAIGSTATSRAMPTMVGSPTAAAPSTLALVLAVMLLCYAGWNIAELVRPGRRHSDAAGALPAPRLAIGCQLVMAITMSYLLLTN